MRLKLISDGNRTRVVDAVTGENVGGVVSVSFEHAGPDDTPTLTVRVLDFEVEAEISENYGAFVVERPAPGPTAEQLGPRLLLEADRPLNPAEVRRLRESFNAAYQSGKALVIEPGVTVYQAVGGRWVPLRPDGVAEDLDAEDLGAEDLGA